MPDHELDLDALGDALRADPGDPPPAFMAAVRRRQRRSVVMRAAGTLISVIVVAFIALAIALPALLAPGVPRKVIAADPGRQPPAAIAPTAANLRRFLDDPTILDRSIPGGPSGAPIRAGDSPDSARARALLVLN